MNPLDGDQHRQPELLRVVSGSIRMGQFRHREDVTDGLDAAPAAFCGPGRDQDFGEGLVRVAPDSA